MSPWRSFLQLVLPCFGHGAIIKHEKVQQVSTYYIKLLRRATGLKKRAQRWATTKIPDTEA